MPHVLTIGRLAQATGVPAKTIRYYEQVGVLPAAARTTNGYRQYTEHGVHRLRFVRRARALGLPLEQLRTLITALDDERRGAVRPRLREVVRGQLAAVQQRMAELELLRRQLEQVRHRLRAPARRDRGEGCRCLELTERRPPR